jgi:GNAT superfamily N-acetyltransferase
MAAWEIARLSREHDRSAFDCDQPVLNEWLQHRAARLDCKDLARTFVAVRPEEKLVLGYYTLVNHCVEFESLRENEAKGLPRLDVPVALLGRLAVERTVSGQGLGELLLIDALRRVAHVADEIGIRAVEVDAIDDAARNFYLKFGFQSLADDPRHLYLPLRVTRKLNLAPLD